MLYYFFSPSSLGLLKVWHKINYEIFTSSLSYFAPTPSLATPKPFATEHNDIKSGLRLMSLPYAEREDQREVGVPHLAIFAPLVFFRAVEKYFPPLVP